MDYRITHRTTYKYAAPVSVSHHAARFEPRHESAQECSDFNITIVPPPAAFAGSGGVVLSMARLNEKLPVGDEPRTQNVMPLYADASEQPIQMPPPIPHVRAPMTVWATAYVLGGRPPIIVWCGNS